MVQQQNTELRILRRRQVEAKLSISRSSIYERINPKSPYYDSSFPKPIELGTGKNPPIGWVESQLDDWIISRVELAGKLSTSRHSKTAGEVK